MKPFTDTGFKVYQFSNKHTLEPVLTIAAVSFSDAAKQLDTAIKEGGSIELQDVDTIVEVGELYVLGEYMLTRVSPEPSI